MHILTERVREKLGINVFGITFPLPYFPLMFVTLQNPIRISYITSTFTAKDNSLMQGPDKEINKAKAPTNMQQV